MKSYHPRAVLIALVGVSFLGYSEAGSRGESVATTKTLVSFSGANGANPYSSLTPAGDGSFYGTTYGTAFGQPYGFGTVFKFTPPGTLTNLVTFYGTNGMRPIGGVTLSPDGFLYGTTSSGGISNLGTLFRITTNGQLTTLVSFVGANGASPASRLTLGRDGWLYGTSQLGGISNLGTIFRLNTNGAFSSLASFVGTNGANPYSELVQAGDNNFYGTTVNGGTFGLGAVFRVTTNGSLAQITAFNGTNGANPYGGLTLASNGLLYGTTTYGGVSEAGTIFQLATNGSLSTLHSFSGDPDGANPWASLLMANDGFFYGTTILGGTPKGTGAWGTVFQFSTNGLFTSLLTFGFDANGVSPYGSLASNLSGEIYGMTFSQGTGLRGTIFRLDVTPPILGLARAANDSVRLNWDAWPGRVYQLQTLTNLAQAIWSNQSTAFTALTNHLAITETISTTPAKLYRVKMILPP